MNYEREIMYFNSPTPTTLSSESESVLTSEDESSSNEEWNTEIVLVDPNGEPIGTLFGDREIRVEMEEIDETNAVVTPAYTYSMKEIVQLYLDNIKEKQVIANQPIRCYGI